MAVRTQCVTSTNNSRGLSDSGDNPFDWSYEELKGRATGIYLPMDRDEVLVKDGDVVDIREQTLDGSHFIVHNQRTGQSGKVPVEYIDIIPEDVDQVPLPTETNDDNSHNKPGLGITRRQGVSRTRGAEVRSRMSAAIHSLEELEDETSSQGRTSATSSTFPRVSQRLSRPSASTTAQSAVVASLPPDRGSYEPTETKDRAQTVLADANHTGGARRETRSATLQTAAAEKKDVTEYEDGFKRVEKYNIVSVSGADRDGRPIIIFSACRLPPVFQINHDVLLRYLKYTLDQYVEQDYTLVYFHHGFTSANKPRFGWLRQVYRELDRKYKKNLKKLYIVHPTNFIRVMMVLFKPLISYKFGRKVTYINRLEELKPILFLERLDIPDEVKRYDITLAAPVRQVVKPDSRSVFHTPLPLEGATGELAAGVVASKHQFGVRLENLVTGEDHIPKVLRTCVEFLEERGMDVVGIFRRAPANATVHAIKEKFNLGYDVDLATYGDPHLAAVLIKLFFRELPEPLMTFDLYQPILQISTIPQDKKIAHIREMIHRHLPPIHYDVLCYLISFLSRVAQNHEVNKMTSLNLAIVLGPNLVWSTNEIATLAALGEINSFTFLLIDNCSDIFEHKP